MPRIGDKKYVFLPIKKGAQKRILGIPKRWRCNFPERLKDENPGGMQSGWNSVRILSYSKLWYQLQRNFVVCYLKLTRVHT